MGRWAQSRRRGGGGPAPVSSGFPESAPSDESWSAEANTSGLTKWVMTMPDEPGLPDVAKVRLLYRFDNTGGYTPSTRDFSEVVELAPIVNSELDCKVAWADEFGNPLSPYSTEKVVFV